MNRHKVATFAGMLAVLLVGAALAAPRQAQAQPRHNTAALMALGRRARRRRRRRHETDSTDWCARVAALPSTAGTQPLAVENEVGANPQNVCKIELAVADQALTLRRYWGTPPIRWATGGWPVYLQHWPNPGSGSAHWYCTPDIASVTPCVANMPAASINAVGGWGYWSIMFSHEVLEMLEDPHLGGTEVCDPVESQYYQQHVAGGVWVSDFVLPSGGDYASTLG